MKTDTSDTYATFVMYGDIEDVVDSMEDADIAQLYKAILHYANHGVVDHLTPVADIAFRFVKVRMDRDKKRWNEIKEIRRAAGSAGGRKKQANATKSKQSVANQAVNVNVNDNVNVNGNVINRESKADKPPRACFQPPTEAEAIAYFAEQGSSEQEAKSFIDYYTAKGWKIGEKAQMKNWKAAARNWIRRSAAYSSSKPTEKKAQTTTRVSITDGFV